MGVCAAKTAPEQPERHVHECLFPMYVVKARLKSLDLFVGYS